MIEHLVIADLQSLSRSSSMCVCTVSTYMQVTGRIRHIMQLKALSKYGLPSRFINIAVPVNFFHRERALGGKTFPLTAPAGFTPLASADLVWAAVPELALLVEEEGCVGIASGVGITPASCSEACEILGKVGLCTDGWRREAWFAIHHEGVEGKQNTEIYLVLIVHRFHHHSHTPNQGWTILLLMVKYGEFCMMRK